ncbi:hypothetical protein RY27_29715, partial [Litorilinea aerophila]
MTAMDPMDRQTVAREAQRTLERLWPRLSQAFADQDPTLWDEFAGRLRTHFPALFERLVALYGHHYDFFYHLEQLLVEAGQAWFTRDPALRALARQRQADPRWFQPEKMLGAVSY